jgi:hypothetical protein
MVEIGGQIANPLYNHSKLLILLLFFLDGGIAIPQTMPITLK